MLDPAPGKPYSQPMSSGAKLLEKTHQLFLKIERASRDADFPEEELSQLMALLHQFEFCTGDEENLRALAAIADHLHPEMKLQHFSNFLVPVERALNRSVREDRFLVTSLDRTPAAEKFPLAFVLENIRSGFNVGSLFRLADSVGAERVVRVGYTPEPDEKTSLGTNALTTDEHFPDLETAVAKLKFQGYQIVALETAQNSLSLFDWQPQGPTALLVGNERFGLEASALQLCDQVVSIPMSGQKNSLNVSQALSVAAFEWKRQWIRSR